MVTRDPWGAFRDEAVALAAEALHATYGVADSIDHLIEEPDPELADFAFPCYEFARDAQQAPPQIAVELIEALPPQEVLELDAKGPYLNFRVDRAELAEVTLASIRELGTDYGQGEATGQTILVEHTSANPTGPLHVGRARNPLLADTLVRVLGAAGHRVTAEYYVNDMGRQAATLVWGAKNIDLDADDLAVTDDEDDAVLFSYGVRQRPLDAASEEILASGRGEKLDHVLVRYYQAANHLLELEDPPLVDRDPDVEIGELIKGFERGNENVATEFREIITRSMKGIRETLKSAHVEHDNLKFESELVLDGSVEQVLDRLKKLDEVRQEADGAWYLDTGALGLDAEKDQMFLTRSDGTTLYGTRDVAYHLDKARRSDALVDVLGEDHKLHAREILVALEALGESVDLDVVFYNFVSLPAGSMSTRSGRVVYLDDLLEEATARAYEEVAKRRGDELDEDEMRRVARQVGLGALRFNIVDVQSEKPITFEWEAALSFDGATAPFVQYSHARTCGILEKGGIAPGQSPDPDPALLEHDAEIALVRQLAQLPSLVKACAKARKVHPMAAYAVEVASALNDFYRDCPVLQAESTDLRRARLALVDATRQVLQNTLELLGIDAPSSM